MNGVVLRLLNGCSVEDVAWLCRGPAMYRNLYTVDFDSGGISTFDVEPGDIPWTVALLLGTRSRKHCFERPLGAKPSVIADATRDFANRMKWAFKFRFDTSSSFSKPLFKRAVASCNEVGDPAVNAFAASVGNLVTRWSKEHFMERFSLPKFVKSAIAWLKGHSMSAQLSDKDGVFVLVPEAVFNHLKMEQVNKPCYRIVSAYTVEAEHTNIIKAIRVLAGGLHRLGFPVWAGEVHKWNNACEARLSSSLCGWSCTIKTHKGEGAVTARSIHSSTGHVFNALGEIANRLLSPILRELPHLCWCSEDVVRLIRSAKVGPRSILLKYDIKEYYLSGAHDELARRSSGLLSGPISGWLRGCLDWLLGFQFVRFRPEVQAHLHVQLGSGMGMRHSGAVADAAFYDLVERDLLSSESRQQHGISVFARFRDDIFVVLSDISLCPQFDKALVSLARPLYVVQKESYSLVGCCMLDLRITKTVCTDGVHRLRWMPYIKPTARHVPLTRSSCHSAKCHGSWPLAEISRMYSRSFNDRSFRMFKQIKIDRFSHFFLRPDVLQSCERWLPKLPFCLGLADPPVKPRVIRLVLPFSVRWNGIQRMLREVHALWSDSLSRRGLTFVVQVSFSKGSQPLSSRVRHLGSIL